MNPPKPHHYILPWEGQGTINIACGHYLYQTLGKFPQIYGHYMDIYGPFPDCSVYGNIIHIPWSF